MATLKDRMLIIDYYDSLIRQVDIYTEEILEKPNETNSTKEFANKTRQKFIDEIKKLQREHVEFIKTKFQSTDRSKIEEKNEENNAFQGLVRDDLFGEKICFVIDTTKCSHFDTKPKFALVLVILDFNLDQRSIDHFKYALGY
jgi:hypothetical protein